MTGRTEIRVREIRRRTRRYRRRRENRELFSLTAFGLFLLAGISVLLHGVQAPGVSAVAEGYGSVLLREDTHTHSVSIETQQMIIARYLEQYPEISVYDTYIDNGATGTNFHRPGFQQRSQLLPEQDNRIRRQTHRSHRYPRGPERERGHQEQYQAAGHAP